MKNIPSFSDLLKQNTQHQPLSLHSIEDLGDPENPSTDHDDLPILFATIRSRDYDPQDVEDIINKANENRSKQ